MLDLLPPSLMVAYEEPIEPILKLLLPAVKAIVQEEPTVPSASAPPVLWYRRPAVLVSAGIIGLILARRLL